MKLGDDYLSRRAQELGLDRGPALEMIQTELDKLYPGQARAASLNDGVLKITTLNASLASELRLRQIELIGQFSQLQSHQITKLQIQIR